MSNTHHSHAAHQLAAMQSIAARATLGGLKDSDYRSAYLPMKKPTKFIVTLKPVPKTENHISGTERSISGCCCKYLPSSRLHVRTSDALKGKPVLNAFRILTNSKFISIDPTYNINKDPILAAALNNMRLTAGGLTRKKAKVSDSDSRGSSKKGKKAAKKKHSDASTSTHIVEARVPTVKVDPPHKEKTQKQQSSTTSQGTYTSQMDLLNVSDAEEQQKTVASSKSPPLSKVDAEQQAGPSTKPRVDCGQQTEPPPKPPRLSKANPPPEQPQQRDQQQQNDDECPFSLQAVASRILQTVAQNVQTQKPRLTFSEMLPKNEPPPKPPRASKTNAPPPPKNQAEECSYKPQDVASRILQTVTQTLFPPVTCEPAPQSITEIFKPHDIKNNSTGLLEQRAAESPPASTYIEQQCSRMKQLEAQVEKLRKDLTKMKADILPEKDMLRCTALTKKLQELNALLVEVKNKQLPCGLSSMSMVAGKGEKLQNQQFYSDHVQLAAKCMANSAVQVDCTPRQDSHSQTVAPTYACTGTGSSPVTTAPSTGRSTPRTTPRSSSTERQPVRASGGSREQQLKVSQSYCPFCERLELLEPVVEADLFRNILRRIGARSLHDIVLAVLLQPDNVYHINISIMNSGESLGCVYANEAAINEAHSEQLFEQFLTFFIVDARNSKAQKQRVLGHTFEFFKK